MASDHAYLYAGLAGETGPGYEPRGGLYRSRDGDALWEPIGDGLPRAPQVRAIAVDPRRPGRVTVGAQDGIYRSEDFGRRWARLAAPAPGLAVWSLALDPHDADIMLAGYEPCAIYRTADDGATWQPLPVEVTFPDITLRPPPQPKRVTGIATDPGRDGEIYASIEVGGLLRSLDGGRSWACATDGLYLVDDAVDLHSVAVSPAHPGVVDVIGRIGMFRSEDRGAHWSHLPVPRLSPRGTYCRALAVAPDDPDTLYVGAGTDFDGDLGALFRSRDHGRSFERLDLGAAPRSTLFAFAVDARRPAHLYCAARGGEVFRSRDSGATWRAHPLPGGASPVYSLAVG